MSKKILVTGGAGYIGSHTAVELLERGYEIVIVDNFSNSSEKSLDRIREITGKDFDFVEADLTTVGVCSDLFKRFKIDAVIHFAGLKAVGESVRVPLAYYQNNLISTLFLLQAMKEAGCKKFVFSSSATVYGDPVRLPLDEECPTSVTNPYGATKLMIEDMLRDVYRSDNEWDIISLRYFNPIGAHKSGLIGENPRGIPNNLLPYVSKVAFGELKELSIFGNDYPTRDGTGCRDYIHVVDLALGHVAALDKLDGIGLSYINLGTGNSSSVLEIVHAFEKASGRTVNYKIVARRDGDIAECYASCKKAAEVLGWTAKFTLDEMCADSWNWQKQNPKGF